MRNLKILIIGLSILLLQGFTQKEAEEFIAVSPSTCIPNTYECRVWMMEVRCLGLFDLNVTWDNIPTVCTEAINRALISWKRDIRLGIAFCKDQVTMNKVDACVVGYTHKKNWKKYIDVKGR